MGEADIKGQLSQSSGSFAATQGALVDPFLPA